jgi:hypothetical protein
VPRRSDASRRSTRPARRRPSAACAPPPPRDGRCSRLPRPRTWCRPARTARSRRARRRSPPRRRGCAPASTSGPDRYAPGSRPTSPLRPRSAVASCRRCDRPPAGPPRPRPSGRSRHDHLTRPARTPRLDCSVHSELRRQRTPEPLNGCLRSHITSFGTWPFLLLMQERSYLREQLSRWRRRPVERLDALQPFEYSACFLHAVDRSGRNRTAVCRLCDDFVDARGGSRLRR